MRDRGVGFLVCSLDARARHRFVVVTASFVLAVLTNGSAGGTVPPSFVVQQQDRAVAVYCAEWRNTHGKLEADQMNRRVIIGLERKYPEVI